MTAWPFRRSMDGNGDRGGRPEAPRWQNWARTQRCTPADIFHPRTLEDLVDIVRRARESGRQIRAAGRGHTTGPLSVTDGYLVDIRGMDRIGPIDVANRLVTVESGVTIGQLDAALRRVGLAVPTNVVLTCVTYGGVIATGSHGSGWNHQTVSDLVEAMTIVTHDGRVVRFTEASHGAAVMNAVRCNLGALGLIHDITLRVEPAFSLREVDQHAPMDLVADPERLQAFVTGNEYVEIFWFPLTDRLWTKTWNRTEAAPERRSWLATPSDYLTSQVIARLWSHATRYPQHTERINRWLRQPRYREAVRAAPDALHYRQFIETMPASIMSFAFKVDDTFKSISRAWMDIVEKVHAKAARGEFPLNMVLEMRAIRNSRALLSPALGREDEHHVYFELISFAGTPGTHAFFDEVALEWMATPELHARPHWAKYFYDIPGIVPYVRNAWGESLRTFADIRDRLDPERMFLNRPLERILYDD